jgi:hypothetical protein
MPRGRRLLPLSPLPLARWPATDRHAWAVARAGSDPLDDAGPAAHWRTVTADHTVLCYVNQRRRHLFRRSVEAEFSW